ncbi:MAG: flavin reductase [Acidobacteria bacterium]|nr:flavin reductase [Acidobacteriota bacterium]
MPGAIHDEHPFADPEDRRDPIRRFRGRLSSPVTVVTAGRDGRWMGLTVSSLLVAAEEEARVDFLLGPDSYLWDAIRDTGRFVVHILETSHRALSDRFAGVAPSPGGPFVALDVDNSEYGPVLDACPSRAYCSLESVRKSVDHMLVEGVIESVDLHDLDAPLQWFRGSYRSLADR